MGFKAGEGQLRSPCKEGDCLGSPVVPICNFSCRVPLLKTKWQEKDTFIIKGLLGNLAVSVAQNIGGVVVTCFGEAFLVLPLHQRTATTIDYT